MDRKMKEEQLIDKILNKYTDNGKIQYAEIGEHGQFKQRYAWYKNYLAEKLPELTFEEIIKFHKVFHKFKDKVYAFEGFNTALDILEAEILHKK